MGYSVVSARNLSTSIEFICALQKKLRKPAGKIIPQIVTELALHDMHSTMQNGAMVLPQIRRLICESVAKKRDLLKLPMHDTTLWGV